MKTNKTTGKTGLVKQAFVEAKKRYLIDSVPLTIFAVISLLLFMLGFFFPPTLFITVPFLMIPAFFAASAINTLANNKNTREGAGFFIMFKEYFSPMFRGGYKILFGFLKGLIVFLISSTIVSTVLVCAMLYNDPDYINLVNLIATTENVDAVYEAFNLFTKTNPTFQNIVYIDSVVSFFFGSFAFIYHLSVNTVKLNYNFTAVLPLPMHDLNLISKNVIKKNKKAFYKDFFSCYWFLGIIFAIGYATGTLIPYFLLPSIDMVQATVLGLSVAFLLLLLFIPYYLCASRLIFEKYKSSYVEILIDLSKKSIEELKKNNQMSEEKEKEVMKIIESQKFDDDNNQDTNENDK